MNAFFTSFKRTLNLRTLLSVFAVTALCFFSHMLTGGYENPPTLLELTAKAFAGNNKNGYTLQQIISAFENSFWFYVALPVLVSMPAVSDFYDEWFGGGFFLNVHRQQIFRYCVSKSAAYALNAAAVFLAGFGIFAAVVSAAFPSYDAEFLSAVYPDGFFAFIAKRVLNVTAAGAVCPVVTVLILISIKEKFLALSIPMLVNYITAQIGGFLIARSYNEENPLLMKLAYLLPRYQFSQSSGFTPTYNLPLFVWYIVWALFFALCGAAFICLVKRRVKSGG